MGASHFVYETISVFAKEVTDKTNGQLTITVHPAGQLGYKGSDHPQLLADGVLKISELIGPYITGSTPSAAICSLPVLTSNLDEAKKMQEVATPILDRELQKKYNSKILFTIPYGLSHFWVNKPAKTIDDFQGMKIRTSGTELTDLVRQMGALPTVMEMTELYTALQRGMVDGFTNDANGAHSIKAEEVVSYGVRLMYNIHAPCEHIAVNLDAWNSLPAETQQVVLDAAKKAEAMGWEAAPKVTKATEEMMLKGGLKEIYDPAPGEQEKFNALGPTVWQKWLDKVRDPASEEALDAVLKALGKQRS